jgi:hypothetical protein
MGVIPAALVADDIGDVGIPEPAIAVVSRGDLRGGLILT